MNSGPSAGKSGKKSIKSDTVVVLDSNEFILGISGDKESCRLLMGQMERMTTVIPFMVVQETVRNLEREYGANFGKAFFRLIDRTETASILWGEPPPALIAKYRERGLPPEDSIIGACCEWVQGEYLISENRHFLEQLETSAFGVINAETALTLLDL